MYEKYLKLLKERNVTTAQVCRETGIPESTMSMWKQRSQDGTPKLSLDNAIKLAKYFDVSIEYFLDSAV